MAINSFNKPSLLKNISISEINFPSRILLLRKLLNVEGLIILDSLFSWVISNSFKFILIFLWLNQILIKIKNQGKP